MESIAKMFNPSGSVVWLAAGLLTFCHSHRPRQEQQAAQWRDWPNGYVIVERDTKIALAHGVKEK